MRLWIVGGFLGAGKTTVIAGLARLLTRDGLRVAAVTNDQGSDLVDTRTLADQGVDVVEVPGGCFCCNFDELARKIALLSRERRPDVILAEPVGSCTDLVATLFRPARGGLLGSNISLGPLTVVADPARVRRCLLRPGTSGFPGQVNELFRHQLGEADIIALNRCDELEAAEAEALCSALREAFPGAQVLGVSAATGKRVDALYAILSDSVHGDRVLKGIDYERYAQAEAALGWLNATARIVSTEPIDVNRLVRELAAAIVARLPGEIAHMKICAVAPEQGFNQGIRQGASEPGDVCKLSMISRDLPADLARRMERQPLEAHLIANIRMHAEPEALRAAYDDALAQTARECGAALEENRIDCFAPSPPRPRHRM